MVNGLCTFCKQIFENIRFLISECECPDELKSKKYFDFERIITISAKEQTKIDNVRAAIREVLDEKAEADRIAALDSEIRQNVATGEQMKIKLA